MAQKVQIKMRAIFVLPTLVRFLQFVLRMTIDFGHFQLVLNWCLHFYRKVELACDIPKHCSTSPNSKSTLVWNQNIYFSMLLAKEHIICEGSRHWCSLQFVFVLACQGHLGVVPGCSTLPRPSNHNPIKPEYAITSLLPNRVGVMFSPHSAHLFVCLFTG